MFQGKTYWLVGASEGLGEALAMRLHEGGAHVVKLAEQLRELGASLLKIHLKMTSESVDNFLDLWSCVGKPKTNKLRFLIDQVLKSTCYLVLSLVSDMSPYCLVTVEMCEAKRIF